MTRAAGRVLHRICPTCDIEILADSASCPTCGSRLVEIRAKRDDLVGTVIDERFEVRDKLGQGGMGAVYCAWQRSVGREVAIKLIDDSYSSDPMAVRRFLREARLASQLSQPNTVSVFDFGQAADGRLFIAMELIRGRTLHAVLTTEGTFSVERAVRIGVQICDAIEAAHALGIIHRDLKLENVIVLDHPPGRDLLKVLDFGLAKNVREPGTRGTESGVIVGTPRYMAPEAAIEGRAVPAGDLYALGVMLGELTTGGALFDGDSLPHIIAQKLSPAQAVARVPIQLRRLIGELLDPEPERRPTAEQTRHALLAAVEREPSSADTLLDPGTSDTMSLRPPPRGAAAGSAAFQPTVATPATPRPPIVPVAPTSRPRRRWWKVVVSAIVLLAAVGGAGVYVAANRDVRATVPPHADAGQVAQVAIDAAIPEVAVDAAIPQVAVDAAIPEVAPPPVPPPAIVTIHVITHPPGAAVFQGKLKLFDAPGNIDGPRNDSEMVLRAELHGYVPTQVTLVPDHSRDVELTLTPVRTTKHVHRDTDDKEPF